MTKGNFFRYYNRLSGADRYFLVFPFKKNMYVADLRHLCSTWCFETRESDQNGGWQKWMLQPGKLPKARLVKKAVYLMTQKEFEEQRKASLLILPLRKEPEYRAVLPGKLFEYLASWRPVLGIGQTDGAMSMILNSTKTGIVLGWDDKTSIGRYLDFCWQKHLEGTLTVDDADISQFTRRNLTRRMAELFDKCI